MSRFASSEFCVAADNNFHMTWGSCCGTFRSLSRAAAKSAGARLRRMGILPTPDSWAQRAEICERCPLRVVRKGVSYCGKPLLEQIQRDATAGCGCPTHDKAKDLQEHCPLTIHHRAARQAGAHCDCKWCQAAQVTVAA